MERTPPVLPVEPVSYFYTFDKDSGNRTINITDKDTFTVKLTGHTKVVEKVKIFKELDLVFTSSQDDTVRVWDIKTGNCLYVLNGHTHYVLGFDIDPKLNKIITCGRDRSIKIWDMPSMSCIKTIKEHPTAVDTVNYVFDHNYFMSKDMFHNINLYDAETGQCLMSYKYLDKIQRIMSSDDGQIVCMNHGITNKYYTFPHTPVSLSFLIILLEHKFIFLHDENLFLLFELFEEWEWFITKY
jgi:WD40 repeat protein